MFKTEMKIITQAIQFLAGGTPSELLRNCSPSSNSSNLGTSVHGALFGKQHEFLISMPEITLRKTDYIKEEQKYRST